MNDESQLIEQARRLAEVEKPEPLNPNEFAWQVSAYAFIAIILSEGLLFVGCPQIWTQAAMLVAIYVFARQDCQGGWRRYNRAISDHYEILTRRQKLTPHKSGE